MNLSLSTVYGEYVYGEYVYGECVRRVCACVCVCMVRVCVWCVCVSMYRTRSRRMSSFRKPQAHVAVGDHDGCSWDRLVRADWLAAVPSVEAASLLNEYCT